MELCLQKLFVLLYYCFNKETKMNDKKILNNLNQTVSQNLILCENGEISRNDDTSKA